MSLIIQLGVYNEPIINSGFINEISIFINQFIVSLIQFVIIEITSGFMIFKLVILSSINSSYLK